MSVLSKFLKPTVEVSSSSSLAKLTKVLFVSFFILFILLMSFLTALKSTYYLRNYEQLVYSTVSFGVENITAWLSQHRHIIFNIAQSEAIINYLTDPNNLDHAQKANQGLINFKSFSPAFISVFIIIDTEHLMQAQQNNYPIAVDAQGNSFELSGHLSLLHHTLLEQEPIKLGSNLNTLGYAQAILNGNRDFFMGRIEHTLSRTSFPLIQTVRSSQGEVLGAVVFNVNLSTFKLNASPIRIGSTGVATITDSKGLFLNPSFNDTHGIAFGAELEKRIVKQWFYKYLRYLNLEKIDGQLQHVWINGRAHTLYARKLARFHSIEDPIYLIFTQDFSEALRPALWDFVTSDLTLMLLFVIIGAVIIRVIYEQYHRSFEMEKLYNRKNYNDLIQLSLVDGLTGLFNRTFFRQNRDEMEHYEGHVGIIVIDIDGLKIINDTFGHEQGDNLIRMCAKIIKGSIPKMKISRIGGDEFMTFLPGHSIEQVKPIIARLYQNIHLFNKRGHKLPLPVSFSIGWASLKGPNSTNSLFREADALLYNHKSENSGRLRTRILKHFSRMLAKADPMTTNHYLEILRIATSIALKLKDTENIDLNNLQLLIRYHNIGLISYDKSPQAINNHIQTGYRIALYLPKLTPIASLILTHEEMYSGQGPMGFKAKEIPIECRILAIANLFIARYHGSCHQNSALALQSIKRDSGRLFDPDLVDILSRIIDSEYKSRSELLLDVACQS